MPIYAYRCGDCGHSRDILQKLSDPLLTTCPSCGAEAFTKQVTAAGFQLKGSGWYVTDFRDNGAGRKADAKGEAKGEGAADGKADKPAEAQPGASSASPSGAEGGSVSGASTAAAAAPAPAPAGAAAAPSTPQS